MAHIQDLGSARPKRYRVRYLDPSGAERSKSFRLKGEADRFMVSIAADLQRGEYADPRTHKVTLGQFAEGWLASQTYGESTREANERRLRLHILPVLGTKTLRQLTPSVVQAWVRGLDAAPSSARVLLTLLSSILGAALDDGLIAKNPVHAKSVKAPRGEQRRVEPWSAERVAAIRASLPDRFEAMADAGSGLGLRQGEVLGLAVSDIDWMHRSIRVRRQVKIVGSRLVFGPPKGNKERDVPLPGEVALRLAAHIQQYPPASVTLPWQSPDGQLVTAELVFTSRERKAINRNSWNTFAWKPALKSAGVTASRDAGFHQLRHFYASSLLHNGVDIRALSEALGHSDPGFTLRVYAHLMPAAADRIRAAVDLVLSSSDGTQTAQKAGEGR